MTTNNDYWSDYWKTDGKQGEVFVDAKGSKPAYLVEHWRAQLGDVKAGSKLLDVACGGGSIFEDLDQTHRAKLQLHASDLSANAVSLLSQRMPEVTTTCSSATQLPYANASFDHVVSQFGIEYADILAFDEAARVLIPSGTLNCLMHYKNGYIDRRNESLLIGAKVALSSRFTETATELIKASFRGAPSKLRKARQAFQLSEVAVSNCMQDHPHGIHEHLYFGFMDMFSRFQNYHQHDIVEWLTAMRKDIKKTIAKVQAIRDVSLDENHILEIEKRLADCNMSDISVTRFSLPNSESSDEASTLAWHLYASRV